MYLIKNCFRVASGFLKKKNLEEHVEYKYHNIKIYEFDIK